MTDKEKLINLLIEFGVGFVFDDNTNTIHCMEGCEKVAGYSCFYTEFVFDDSDNFIMMGAYE